jgi:hypothetical protein
MADLTVVLNTSKYIEMETIGVSNHLIYLTGSTEVPYVTTSNGSIVSNAPLYYLYLGGQLFNAGDTPPTRYGIVLNTVGNPDQYSTIEEQGTGYPSGYFFTWSSSSEFWSPPYAFTAGTTYYLKAFVEYSGVYYYGNQKTILLNVYLPTVTTSSISNILPESATGGGNVTSDGNATVTARGIVWDTTNNPTIGSHLGITSDGTGTGAFSSSLSPLSVTTTYFVKAYATNSVGTSYGSVVSFVTTDYTLTCSEITGSGGAGVTEYNIPIYESGGGVIIIELNANSVPDKLEIIHNGSKKATSAMTGANGGPFDSTDISTADQFIGSSKGTIPDRQSTLISETSVSDITLTSGMQQFIWWKYNAIDYATSTTAIARITGPNGTAWNIKRRCTSNTVPVDVTTDAITNITNISASCGGDIASDGGNAITAKGVCWSTSSSPTIANSHSSDGTGTASFTSSIISLSVGVTYYVRAYATNGIGTTYGNEVSFTATFTVGQSYQSGTIAHIFAPGETGYVSGEVHGLVAHTSFSSGNYPWGETDNVVLGGIYVDQGVGAQNTNIITSYYGTGTYAAKVAQSQTLGGYSWFLPSEGDMHAMYDSSHTVISYQQFTYWTSSEYPFLVNNFSHGYTVNMYNSGFEIWTSNKLNNYLIMPVHNF